MCSQQLFGRRLKEWRKALDLTQLELAKKTGYAVSTVRKIEAGTLRPSRIVAQRLIDVLKVPPDERASFLRLARGLVAGSLSNGDGEPNDRHDELQSGALPMSEAPLVGRVADVQAALQALLLPTNRLFTLTGPPGVGKTRLSVAVATALEPHLKDGVVFVELGDILDAAFVVGAILQALKLSPQGATDPLDQLKKYLHDKALLLVLDNFEQVVSAVPAVREIIAAAPALKVLVTSRVSLGILGEQIQPVAPLTVPPEDAAPTVATILVYPAAALCLQRMGEANPEMALRPEACAAVLAICRLLDGLPLALELAAVRVRDVTPCQLLAQLEQRLPIPEADIQSREARHATLTATIDWSYKLLSPEVRTLFARLAVFSGGWTLAAAQAVCDFDRELNHPVVDGLTTLLAHNLIAFQPQAGSTPRYTMLQTIHTYALEWLAVEQDRATIKRHLDYYIRLADTAARHYQREHEIQWLDLLEGEHNNLRAALRWASEQDDIAPAMHLAGRLGRYWSRRGYWQEGIDYIDALLLRSGPETTQARLDATLARMMLAHRRDGFREVQAWAEEVLRLAVVLGNHDAEADARVYLGANAHSSGDWKAAEEHFTTGLARYHATNNFAGMAATRYQQWRVTAHAGEIMTGLQFLEEAVALCRKAGNVSGLAQALNDLGAVRAEVQGCYSEARALTEEALALAQRNRDIWGICFSLRNLGEVLVAQGDLIEAEALFHESLALAHRFQHEAGIDIAQRELGVLAWLRNDFLAATQQFQASLRLAEQRNDHWALGQCYCCLGHVAYRTGDRRVSAQCYGQSLFHFRQINMWMQAPLPLLGLAWTHALTNPTYAASLFGTVTAALDRPDYRLGWFHTDRVVVAEMCAALDALFTDEPMLAVRVAGRETPLQTVVDDVLNVGLQRVVGG
ncbi:MAG: hypothetical protein NVSMB42_03370 [Herpetosiphon sp.]